MISHSRRCYLHIGVPKTGTTMLQKFLYQHRAALRARGLLYPEVSLRGYGHHDIAFMVSDAYPEWATRPSQSLSMDMLAAQLHEAVSEYDGDVLLSSENFYLYPDPKRLQVFFYHAGLGRHEILPIVYLRRQDEAIDSWYNQAIKAQGATEGVADFVRRWDGLWDYEAQLGQWAATFGKGALCVRAYDPRRFGTTPLLDDFFGVTGTPINDLAAPAERVNAGLNREMVEFQRLLNALPLTPQDKRLFHHKLIDLSVGTEGSGLFDEGPLLDADCRKAIMDRYRAGNAAVTASYLAGDAFLLDEGLPAAGAARSAEGLSTETLARIMGWLMIKAER